MFTENKEILLVGDFNFNLLEDNCSNRNWLQITESANLEQLVDSPIRVTPVSSTLIDHAYSNRAQYIVDVFVPYYALSEHYPVCVTRKLTQGKSSDLGHKSIYYRHMKNFSQDTFINELESQPWSLIDIYDNPDDAMDFFVFLFNTVLNENAPKQTKRVKHLLQPNWYNADISKASRKRDFYHQIKDAENYIIWRNRVKA